jgi:hypothetical protein
MPPKLQLAALAALGSTYGLTILYHRRKYAQIARVLIIVGEERDVLKTQIRYLAEVLEENGVELSEFDLIALNNPIPQTEE